ncbi:MAG: hypothetical protein H8D67_18790 [Deltaproteobacteria bacterium]|nr:hypothetical protein [Deltaproteobacteria bacterium]
MPTLLPQLIIGIGEIGGDVLESLQGSLKGTDYETAGFYSFLKVTPFEKGHPPFLKVGRWDFGGIKVDDNDSLEESELQREISRLFASQLPNQLQQTFTVPIQRYLNIFLVGSLQEEMARSSFCPLMERISEMLKTQRRGQYRLCALLFTGFSSQNKDERQGIVDMLTSFNEEAVKLGSEASELVSRVFLLTPVASTGREITSLVDVKDSLYLLLSTFLFSPLSTEEMYRDQLSFAASFQGSVKEASAFCPYASFGVASVEFPTREVASFLSHRFSLRLLDQMLEAPTKDQDEVVKKAEGIHKRDIHSFISRDSTGKQFDSQIRFGEPSINTPVLHLFDSAQILKQRISLRLIEGWIGAISLWTKRAARNIVPLLSRLKRRRLLIQDEIIASIEDETQDILLSSTAGVPLAERYLYTLKEGFTRQKEELMLKLKSSSTTSVDRATAPLEGNLGSFEKAASKKPAFSAMFFYLGLFGALGVIFGFDILRRTSLTFPKNLLLPLAGFTFIALLFLFFLTFVPHLSVRKAFRQLIRIRDRIIQGIRNGLTDRFTIYGILGQQVRIINRALDAIDAMRASLLKIRERMEKEREELREKVPKGMVVKDATFRKFVYPEDILKRAEEQLRESVLSEANLSSLRKELFGSWREGKIDLEQLFEFIFTATLTSLREDNYLYEQRDEAMAQLKPLMRQLSPFLAESYDGQISGEGVYSKDFIIAGEEFKNQITELLSETEFQDFQFVPSEDGLRILVLKTRLNIPFGGIKGFNVKSS